MGPMQCLTVKAIMISIAAQEVLRPLRTFGSFSFVPSLSVRRCVYFCSRFLAEIAGRKGRRKTEEEGRGGKKGTADVVSNRRASDGHGTGLPVDAPMGLRLEGSFDKC